MNEEAIEVEVKKETPRELAIQMNDKNELVFKDHKEFASYAQMIVAAKMVPKHLTNYQEVMAAWNLAAQLKLPPQISIRNIAIIEGVPSLFGDLPLALAQRHPDFIMYDEYVIDSQYNKICLENKNLDADIFSAVVLIQRKGMEKPQSFTFTIAESKKAGINKEKTAKGYDTVWAKYPKDMIIRKARIRALRAIFADAISGAGIAEDFNYAPDLHPIKDVTPQKEFEELKNILGARQAGSNIEDQG